MKKILLSILLIAIPLQLIIAQRENARCYMGANIGMDFLQLNTMTGIVNGVANQPMALISQFLVDPLSISEESFLVSDKDSFYLIASSYQGGTKDITYSEVDWLVTNANVRETVLTPLNFAADLKGDEVLCVNALGSYNVQISTGTGSNAVTKFTWNFGDGSPLITEDNLNQLSYSQTHRFAKIGKYQVMITPYKADGSILIDKIKTLEVRVSPCVMPVNPNIHTFNNN